MLWRFVRQRLFTGDRSMRRRRMLRPVSLCLTVALALFGCSPSGADEASPKAPGGGWPGLDTGQLTARMCGLLTKADYKQVGQNLVLPLEPSGGEQKASSNSLSCV